MFSATPHRIDPPGDPIRRGPASVSPLTGIAAVTGLSVSGPSAPDSGVRQLPTSDEPPPAASSLLSRDQWLRLHADDLITKLQAWAADLDARESLLNTRSSPQDQPERGLRLEQQDFESELAQQKRSIEQIREQLNAQAGRLAFDENTRGCSLKGQPHA